MSQSSPAVAARKSAGSAGMLIGLVPWVLFTIIAEHGTLKVGSIAALVIAVGVCVYSSRGGGRPKLIEGAAVVTFGVFTVIAFVADPSLSHWLTRYARAIAAAALALLVFASLQFVPFTEQYARERVPQQYWNSPKFKAVNRRLRRRLRVSGLSRRRDQDPAVDSATVSVRCDDAQVICGPAAK
jgi:hypothetical protein